MKEKTYLAFYKAWNYETNDFQDRLIATWTNGPYSHVEFIVHRPDENKFIMCSALGSLNTVRCKEHKVSTHIYDYIEVNLGEPKRVLEFYKAIEGSKYDYKGIILSQVFPLGIDNPYEWFCSETCVKASQISAIDNKELWKVKPESISPNDLAYMVGLLETDKKVKFIKNLRLLNKKFINDIYEPFNIKKVNKLTKEEILNN